MTASLRLKDQPLSERPRERLAERGPDALSHAELIAILLRTGLKGANAVEIGRQLLQKFGTLQALARASVEDLRKRQGHRARQGGDAGGGVCAGAHDGEGIAARIARARQSGSHRAAAAREKPGEKRGDLPGAVAEHAAAADPRGAEFRTGTLDTLLVHPREVFKAAIAANAAAVVLAHNHPSGDPTPSEADIKVTRDLIRAGQLLKIEVLDHVIIGRATPERPKDYASLRELGYFYS